MHMHIYTYIWQFLDCCKNNSPPNNCGMNCESPYPGPHSRHVCYVTQQTCLLCVTADMSAVQHSRHVCCVTQQTCLLCDRGRLPREPTQKSGFASQEVGRQASPSPATQNPGKAHLTRLTRREHLQFGVAGGGGCLHPLLQHKTAASCRKQQLWTRIYHSLLDLDTCLTPEAGNWTDLNCRL